MRQHRVHYVTVHGHRRAFVKLGSGPAVLLLHGLGCDHRTWLPVIDALSRHYTVIAPDLLGHGRSDKPRADYSVGGFANGMRDLLTVLGIDRATIVGHSFGGGVAMQFAYQFPESVERAVLVSSGGLGHGVSIALRAATLPGAATVLRVASAIAPRPLARLVHRLLRAVPALAGPDLVGVVEAFASFTADGRAQRSRRRCAGRWTGRASASPVPSGCTCSPASCS